MPTPDGISDDDWGVVRELGVEIVNVADDEAAATLLRQRLLAHLVDLQAKYGTLPSILATRADYIDGDDLEGRLTLLIRAHALASSRGDHRNTLYTASSLAALYLNDFGDAVRGREWLATATESLTRAGDTSDVNELNRLAEVLRTLEAR